MTDSIPRVLITFYSRGGTREALALACGVGAVQARGLIRLRRIRDGGDSSDPPDDAQILERMRKEYVAPTEADIAWADALVFCGSEREESEWGNYLELIAVLDGPGRMEDKLCTVIAGPGHPNAGATSAVPAQGNTLTARLLDLGLIAVPAATPGERDPDEELPRAQKLGRRIATLARAIKRASS